MLPDDKYVLVGKMNDAVKMLQRKTVLDKHGLKDHLRRKKIFLLKQHKKTDYSLQMDTGTKSCSFIKLINYVGRTEKLKRKQTSGGTRQNSIKPSVFSSLI